MNLIRDPLHMKFTYQDSLVRLARIKIYIFSSSSQSSSSKNIVSDYNIVCLDYG